MQFVTSHGSHRREISIEINGIHRAAKRTVPAAETRRTFFACDSVQALSNLVGIESRAIDVSLMLRELRPMVSCSTCVESQSSNFAVAMIGFAVSLLRNAPLAG
jgi:hypothetical protein